MTGSETKTINQKKGQFNDKIRISIKLESVDIFETHQQKNIEHLLMNYKFTHQKVERRHKRFKNSVIHYVKVHLFIRFWQTIYKFWKA